MVSFSRSTRQGDQINNRPGFAANRASLQAACCRKTSRASAARHGIVACCLAQLAHVTAEDPERPRSPLFLLQLRSQFPRPSAGAELDAAATRST